MITTFFTASLHGLKAVKVTVEAHLAQGLSSFHIVGLPDTSVQEARQRIQAAIKHSGFQFPHNFHITVNLAPASVKKEGSTFDVPIALAVLGKQLKFGLHTNMLLLGELGLDGTIRPIHGVLSAALMARQQQISKLFIPKENAEEAALVSEIEIYPIESLAQLVGHLIGTQTIAKYERSSAASAECAPNQIECLLDIAEIIGQSHAKRALEIAAAGNHNILFSGPPGAGKTMLARTLPGILPPMNEDEIIEVTQLYSAFGLQNAGATPIRKRPFRNPHHSASAIALVGGGSWHGGGVRCCKPGEISLAHRGVLFLDELPEFHTTVLEQLREPMESGSITIARTFGTNTLPARFLLVAAHNPCPCGFASDPDQECTCSAAERARYRKKLSGPLLDRIDLGCEVPRMQLEDFHSKTTREKSTNVRERVVAARERAIGRAISCNADIPSSKLWQFANAHKSASSLLTSAANKFKLSPRGFTRLVKVSRTIADLAGSNQINEEHATEALAYKITAHT